MEKEDEVLLPCKLYTAQALLEIAVRLKGKHWVLDNLNKLEEKESKS